jgi:molybdopterin synthase sulfur carrier subunit
MSVKVMIPTPLRNLTQNQAEVTAEGANIKELIDNLGKSYDGLKSRILDENGKIRRFVNIYLNEEDIRFLQGEATAIKAGDQISIVPAIAGGK